MTKKRVQGTDAESFVLPGKGRRGGAAASNRGANNPGGKVIHSTANKVYNYISLHVFFHTLITSGPNTYFYGP